jgi:hypothetical protein
MNANRNNKTQRRRAPATPVPEVPGPYISDNVAKATEDSLDALFAAETLNNFQQPWQKLDRGSRMDRLRKFVQCRTDLSLAERASLLAAVLQAYELKQLNSKVAVEYDHVEAVVLNIRGLRERTNVNGLRTFRIEPISSTTRTTQKQRKTNNSNLNGASVE